MKKELDLVVFPSTNKTIKVIDDSTHKENEVGYLNPCHLYEINECVGFQNGETQYVPSTQNIQFVQKNTDGTVIPGLQSEQLALVMLHRLETMNEKFPSIFNDLQKQGLKLYLLGCKMRIEDRFSQGVMGTLKK